MSTKPLFTEDNLEELTLSTHPILDAGPCRPHVEDYVRPALPNLMKIIEEKL